MSNNGSRDEQRIVVARERYAAAGHAVQSGVATEIGQKGAKGAAADPKHLRTGINMAMCDHTALIRLLIDKRIITDAEYHEALADEAEREKARCEERLTGELGTKVTLA